jgi:hypothetical protein
MIFKQIKIWKQIKLTDKNKNKKKKTKNKISNEHNSNNKKH